MVSKTKNLEYIVHKNHNKYYMASLMEILHTIKLSSPELYESFENMVKPFYNTQEINYNYKLYCNYVKRHEDDGTKDFRHA